MIRKLTTRRALRAYCGGTVGLALAAIFAFGVTPLAVVPALACVLTMAPAMWVAGELHERGRR